MVTNYTIFVTSSFGSPSIRVYCETKFIVMGSEVVIIPTIFAVIFGVFYLYYSSRNKERMALIEKGADASIFYADNRKLTPVWRVVVLNLALLGIGIGIGIFIASILVSMGIDDEVAYPGTIFLMGGIGLLVSFFMTKKLLED